jgi:CubicO group peptidase (beta-lactamase class C family)
MTGLSVRRTRLSWTAAIVGAALAFSGLPTAQAHAAPSAKAAVHCDDPGADYQTASAESVGIDQAKLRKAIDYWTAHGSDTVKVFRNNCFIDEGSIDPVADKFPHIIFSHTKTILSLVVGRAQQQGKLNVNDPIGKYLPAGLGDRAHRALTIRNFLTMTTGLRMNWTREMGGEVNGAKYDRVREALSLPIDHKPGTWFEYAQTPLFVLTYVVERAVGKDFQEYTDQELLSKIGIPRGDWAWGRDRAGHSDGPGWSVQMRPIHFPRFGQLMMNNGTWNGKRLINPSYLRELRTGTAANPGYGYLTWLNSANHYVNASIWGRHAIDGTPIPTAPKDMYFSWGYVGQHTFVIPSLNMIVTRTGNTAPDSYEPLDDPGNALIMGRQKKAYYEFFKLLMDAVRDARAPQADPYNQYDWTFDYDPGQWVEPVENLAAVNLGPNAPEGCPPGSCDGHSDYDGTMQSLTDLANAWGNSVREVVGVGRDESSSQSAH